MLNANNDKNDNSYPEVLVSSVSLLGPSEVLSVLTVSSMAMSLAELAIQVGDTAVLFSLSLQLKLSCYSQRSMANGLQTFITQIIW